MKHNSSDRFLKFIKKTLFFENGNSACGYANHPLDKGGETISGVTRKYFPNLTVWKSLDALPTVKEKKAYRPTEEEWNEIYELYYQNFYLPVKADYIDNIDVAFLIFDWSVGSGVVTTIKQVQKVLGVTVDGKIGPQTIASINVQPRVWFRLKEARDKFYENIVTRTPSQKVFLKGWLNRSNAGRISE